MGSPNIGGNSDLLLDRCLAGASSLSSPSVRVEVSKVVLATKKISACKFCQSCRKSGPGVNCCIKDDMTEIYEQILNSDIVIHSFPVWFFSAPGFVKSYLDRYSAFYTSSWDPKPELQDRMKGKVFACISVCGDPDYEKICEPGITSFRRTAEFCKLWSWAGSVSAHGEESGDIARKLESLQQAFELGKKCVSCHLEH